MKKSNAISDGILPGLPGFWLIGSLFLFVPVAVAPGFRDAYLPAKWIVGFWITSGATLWWAGTGAPISVPRVSSVARGGLALLLIFSLPGLAQALARDPSSTVLTVLPWWMLFFLAYTIYAQDGPRFLKGLHTANAVALSISLVYGALQVANLDPWPALLPDIPLVSLFGNATLESEFISLSLLLAMQSPHFHGAGGKWLAFRGLLLAGLAELLLLRSFGAIVGFMVAAAWLFRKPTRQGSALFVSVAVGCFLAIGISLGGNSHWAQGKVEHGELRVWRWENTLRLIAQAPLFGGGLSTFADRYPLVHSAAHEDSESTSLSRVTHAHNDPLEIAADLGIPAAVILSLFMITLGLRQPFFLFLFVDGIFNFPLHQPYVYFASAVMAAISIPIGRENKIFVSAFARFLCAVPLLLLATLFSLSEFTYRQWPRAQENRAFFETLCRLLPSDGATCLAGAQLEIAREEYSDAARLLESSLNIHPFHEDTIRWLAYTYFREGNPRRACQVLQKYDSEFGPGSGVHPVLIENCAI